MRSSFWGPQGTAPPHVALASVAQTQDLITGEHRDGEQGYLVGKLGRTSGLSSPGRWPWAARPDFFYQTPDTVVYYKWLGLGISLGQAKGLAESKGFSH